VRGLVQLVVLVLEILGGGAQRVLPATVIPHEEHILEAGSERALCDLAHHRLEGLRIN